MLNFTWWVNRKDAGGRNIFQGGFLGLDNIGVFDRSQPLPTGGLSTSPTAPPGWPCIRSICCVSRWNSRCTIMSTRTSRTKFFEHFLSIADAMDQRQRRRQRPMGRDRRFYYDVLNLPDGRPCRCGALHGRPDSRCSPSRCWNPTSRRELPEFARTRCWFLEHRPDLARLVSRWEEAGQGEQHLLSLLRGHRMKALLRRMLGRGRVSVGLRRAVACRNIMPSTRSSRRLTACSIPSIYEPGESTTDCSAAIRTGAARSGCRSITCWSSHSTSSIRYYGDDFQVEFPVGSGRMSTLTEIADELRDRLARLFLSGADGRRPCARDQRTCSSTIPTSATICCSTNTFMARPARGLGCVAPDRLDRTDRAAAAPARCKQSASYTSRA